MPPIIRAVSRNTEQSSEPDPAFGPPPGKRVLGLDVGTKRIGIAVSDELRLLARGLNTLQRQSKRVDLEKLADIIQEYGIAEIVVGHPLRLGGETSAQTDKVTAFAAELRDRIGLPVHLWDERLTSAEANRVLRDAEVSTHKRARAVDRIAAILILQSFMEARRSGYR